MTLLTKTGLTVGLVTMAMLAAVACGKPKEEPLSQASTTSAAVRATASCATIAEAGSCSEYVSATASFGVERSMCGATHGEFALHACPTAGRVGVCELGGSEIKRYYAGGTHGFSADSARADCEQNGLKGRFLAAR